MRAVWSRQSDSCRIKLYGFTWMLQVLTPEPESPEGSTPESEAESNPKRNFRPPQGENFRRIPMKRAFLLIVVPALLVALGFAQTPARPARPVQRSTRMLFSWES